MSSNTATVYGIPAEIPTSLNLPCYGSGKVSFVLAPTSGTAVPVAVTVTYQSIGVDRLRAPTAYGDARREFP